ncbi:MAG TPA: hypothetical protein VES20_22165, partial [Bryobacteraceae bacterium]|nr:hypothetical protein [Bryobacteraceae bacterium]
EQRYSTAMVETYIAVRFPEYKVGFKHASVMDADKVVESYSPTVVVIMPVLEPLACAPSQLGGQDRSGYARLVSRWSASYSQVRVLIVLPPACPASTEERRQLVAAASMARYTVLLEPEAGGPGYLSTPESHARVARQIIDAWSLPAEVVHVEINAQANRSTTTPGTTVRELAADEWVFWTQDDRTSSLPYELLTIGFADLNQRRMKVVGLRHPQYRLTIDGRDFGIYPRAAFDTGLDVGRAATPSSNRSSNVYRKVLERLKWWCEQQRSPKLVEPLPDDEELVAAIVESARPASHDFELQPVN